MLNQIKILRAIGISEGISFLVLLLIAMPLKYYFEMPMAVKIVGWAHGGLFIAYVAMVFLSIKVMKWNLLGLGVALAASLIPLGTFFLDKSWKQREQELTTSK
jgi:integral membrane protein